DIMRIPVNYTELAAMPENLWSTGITAMNEARLVMMNHGIANGARWILPLDGNHFLTREVWTYLAAAADRHEAHGKTAFKIPVVKIDGPQSTEWINGSTLYSDLFPHAPTLQEGMIGFRNDSPHRYQPGLGFGRRNKLEAINRICGTGEDYTPLQIMHRMGLVQLFYPDFTPQLADTGECGCQRETGSEAKPRPMRMSVLHSCGLSIRLWYYPCPEVDGARIMRDGWYRFKQRQKARFILLDRASRASVPATSLSTGTQGATWGGDEWEDRIRLSAVPHEGGMVVLVTGAAGFVGSHTSLALKERGDGVIGLDNFNDYYPVALKRAREERLLSNGVFVVEGDINDQQLLSKLFEIVRFTHVLHLAAQAGVRYAVHNPLAFVQSNVLGFVNMLEAVRKADHQPAIVYASSSSVYGLNKKVPFSESDRTDRPASLYAATKKADEMLGHTYNHIYGLSITALRFFTVYGPWGRPDMAYFSFTRNIAEGKPIKIFRGPNGQELARDFTFIDDVVKGCVAALDTATPSVGVVTQGKKRRAQFRVFNLGNTQPVKVTDFVKLLEKHLETRAIRDVVPMPSSGEVLFTHANVTRAENELGYSPSTDLDEGLQKFVQWYKSYYQKGGSNERMLIGYRPY
ncbi:unnamed protein product, partial [Closterium sp. Naga37s-1]